MVRRAERQGHLCTTFRYPNDQSLQKSARMLSRELKSLENKVDAVQIVAHSMGGLVARAVIEDPQLDPGHVIQLIMIAPPNSGSQLARYAFGLDLVEFATSRDRRREAGLISGSLSDGLSEATRDPDARVGLSKAAKLSWSESIGRLLDYDWNRRPTGSPTDNTDWQFPVRPPRSMCLDSKSKPTFQATHRCQRGAL